MNRLQLLKTLCKQTPETKKRLNPEIADRQLRLFTTSRLLHQLVALGKKTIV